MSSTNNNNSIKIIFGSEIRRFPYPLSSNGGDQFELFSGLLKHSFALAPNSSIKLTYKDDEGDEITIASQMELDEAFSVIHPSSILRLNLIVVKSTPTTTTTTTTATATVTEPEKLDTIATWKAKLAENKARYANQLTVLKEKHNLTDVPEAVLVKQLAASNGNIEFVLAKQQQRKQRQQHRQQKIKEIMDKYPDQVKLLQEMGYSMQPPICIWLLKKHDGDLRKVVETLNNKNNNCDKKKFNRFQMREKYATQLQELRQLGFNGPRIIWLLHKCNGDVSKVVAKRLNRINNTSQLTSKYEDQLKVLSAKGFCCLPVNIRLLNKFDGDVTKVESKLAKRQSKHNNHNHNNGNGNWHRRPFHGNRNNNNNNSNKFGRCPRRRR